MSEPRVAAQPSSAYWIYFVSGFLCCLFWLVGCFVRCGFFVCLFLCACVWFGHLVAVGFFQIISKNLLKKLGKTLLTEAIVVYGCL